MKNKRTEGIVMLISGLIIIGAGLYIYFVAHTIYPHSSSSRVQHMNWLLENLGRLPTAILICAIGLIPFYGGLKRLIRGN